MRFKDLEDVGARLPTLVTHRDLMNNPLPLILDRSEEDVNYIERLLQLGWENFSEEERKWWFFGQHKGAYNYGDLNRVGYALNFVAERLTVWGYPVEIAARTNWTENDLFYTADLRQLREDVTKLREALAQYASTPEVPTKLNHWQEANDFEQIICDVWELLQKMIQGLVYADTIWCGAWPI